MKEKQIFAHILIQFIFILFLFYFIFKFGNWLPSNHFKFLKERKKKVSYIQDSHNEISGIWNAFIKKKKK